MNINLPETINVLLDTLEKNNYEAYVVGGCVRDSLMNTTPKDWDICTSATPDIVKRIFKGYKIIETGLKHGTITVVVNDEPYEITTYRVDGIYEDNRHPKDVIFTSNIVDDLSRRDFTINAMAYSPTRGFVDCFDGISDIKNHIIRCVGNPDTRFNEDGLRILRAVRFSIKYNFDIDYDTLYSIYQNISLLKNISIERINSEITQALHYGENGVLLHCIDEVLSTYTLLDYNSRLHRLIYRDKDNLPVTLLLLFKGVVDDISDTLHTLKYPNRVIKTVTTIDRVSNNILDSLDYYDAETLSKMILHQAYDCRYDIIDYCLLVYAHIYDECTFDYLMYKKLLDVQEYLHNVPSDWCYSLKQLAVNGNDIKQLGYTGTEISTMLNIALNGVMFYQISNIKDDIIIYLSDIKQ